MSDSTGSSGERRNRTRKMDEWVNALVTVVIPMDLPHHATKTEKLDGAQREFEELEIPEDFVVTVSWEDAP